MIVACSFLAILALILGITSLIFVRLYRKNYPIRWSCPKCDFKISSNSQYANDIVRMQHKHPTD